MSDSSQPPPPPGFPAYSAQQAPEPRPVSFYVAIFLGLLLLVSAGLNVLLLVVSALGSAAGALGGSSYDDAFGVPHRVVAVAGDKNADSTVLRVPISGAIMEGSSALLGAQGGTVTQVKRALDAARRDKIRGILFDINSPGGGVTDSDEIWRLIKEFKREEPDTVIVALMGDVAASGGYYIAAACDHIMARRTTITGSIGVIISTYDVSKGLEMIGVESVSIISEDTPYKDILSPTRAMRPDEKAKVRAIVQDMYEQFLDVVDLGRPELTRDQVRTLATGEIYSASQALENGLVDEIGSIEDAIDRVEDLMEVDAVRVVEHRRVPGLMDILLSSNKQPGVPLERAIGQVLQGTTGPRFLYFWPGGR